MDTPRRAFAILTFFAYMLTFPAAANAQEIPGQPEDPKTDETEIAEEPPENPMPEILEIVQPRKVQDASWFGLWEGCFRLEDEELPVFLSIFPSGALLDIPDLGAFGWPVATIKTERIEFFFSLSLGEEPLECAGPREGNTVSGTMIQGGRKGSFVFTYSENQPDLSGERDFDTGRGVLPGTLLTPSDSQDPSPLVILLPGSGATDREGNNWQVPGKNDSFRLFAQALAEAGIASYRYDKRGSGKAYRLGEDEEKLIFADHVADAAACIRSFQGDQRFSKVLVFGHGDGALIGAAALREARADGLAAFGASGRTLRDLIGEAASGAPEEYRIEIERVLAQLDSGSFVEEVSPYIENLFRRSFQPYLASWLRYDLKKELADLSSAGLPILLIQGDLDLQVTMGEFDLLREAAPGAEAVLLPETNHMLKQVGNDVEENYASFSDPSFPLSPGLVPALLDFLTRVPARRP